MNKSFQSSIDSFLQQFDQSNTPSTSQRKEVQKHARISKKRDHATNKKSSQQIWPQD